MKRLIATLIITLFTLPAFAEELYTVIGDGRQTVATAGTRVRLSTSSVACSRVVIVAETDNTNPVTVGGDTVVGALATRRGVPLSAGDSITVKTDNLNRVWLDSVTNGEGVTYTYYI